ncbi:MAG TPA: hypothetical protein VIX19_02105, partial [Terriglobales bacterium]
VCGIDYGVSHECSGLSPFMTLEEVAPPPSEFSPFYYIRMAFHIVRVDGMAIRRASRDPNALVYGAALSAFSAAIIFLVSALPGMLAHEGRTPGTIFWGLLLGLVFFWTYMGVIAAVQIVLCHAIAKIFLGATGTLAGVTRPLFLGWFVNILILIPVVGIYATAIAWTAVLTLVFEGIDRIGRLRAFLISAGINAAFVLLEILIPR